MKKIQNLLSKAILPWVICAVGAAFYCYEYLLRIAPATMLSPLMREFHLHAPTLSFIIALFYFSYAPLQLVVGVTHDIFGPRRVLIIAVGLCSIGSLLFGLSVAPFMMSVARLMIGFGGAFAFVGAVKLGSMWLPRKHFSLFVGLLVAVGMLGGIFGNVSIAVLLKYINWRLIYFYFTALGGLLLLAVCLLVKEKNPLKRKQKLIHANKHSQTRKQLLRIFKNSQLWLLGIIAALLYLSLSAFAELWGSKFARQAYDLSTAKAAMVNSLVFLGWLIGPPLMGWLSDKLDRYRPLIIINAFLASIVSCVMLVFTQLPLYFIEILFFLLGFFCSTQVLCITAATQKTPAALTATTVSFINCLVMVCGLVAQPLIGKLLDFFWLGKLQADLPLYSIHSFRSALSILPVAFLLAGILGFFIKEKKKPSWIQELYQKSFIFKAFKTA